MTASHAIVSLFKDAMSTVATSVAIITCLDEGEGGPAGATVSSFTPVSLDPPMILVCLNRDSHTLQCLTRSKQFAVNVLRNGQAGTAATFATTAQRHKRFKDTGWEIVRGLPRINDSLAWLSCRLIQLVVAGDHVIAVGGVTAVESAAGPPLIYHERGFGTLVGQ